MSFVVGALFLSVTSNSSCAYISGVTTMIFNPSLLNVVRNRRTKASSKRSSNPAVLCF